jgi:hypothetical protein
MIVINHPQGSPEWLAARVGRATASRFSDVLAMTRNGEAAVRRNYRAELVVERLTGTPASQFVSFDMKLGTEREPFARSEYEARFGAFVIETGFCQHDTLLAGSSPDGLIDDDGGIEIKCPSRSTHVGYLSLQPGTPPPEYMAQIQGNLWVTERKWWDFVSFNPEFPENTRLIRRRVARDDQYIATLAAGVEAFLQEVQRDEEFALNYKEAA